MKFTSSMLFFSYFYLKIFTMKKLFLLDAYALIYRAYFALNKNPRINSKGLNTSAIMGFLNTLYEVLKNENPTHIDDILRQTSLKMSDVLSALTELELMGDVKSSEGKKYSI